MPGLAIRYLRMRLLLQIPRRLLWLLITAACCAQFCCCTNTARSQQIGKAYTIRNDVEATRHSEPKPIVLRQALPILQNDTIHTLINSAALLALQDGTGIAIAPVANVELNESVYNPKDPAKPKLVLLLRQGAVRVKAGETERCAVEIRTSSPANICVASTVTITVSARGSTTVSVAEGRATVTATGRTVTVVAGQSTVVLRGGPPTSPVPSPPAPPIVAEMDRLLQTASLQEFGTRAAARSPAVEAPSDAGTYTFSPNIDPKIQSEIAGGEFLAARTSGRLLEGHAKLG